ncbi:MAG: bifunctional phosphopantothenoylcysteine decarboxylase/phosphopantothenate--cysteine ligase CoaBC [Thermoplasmata archaeon]|nr:bifunctional phosphopantothenoylcysteine decarboxylase/phosphopantothenate--cysteine ligase CoaBC [Thermoplasmata archaeon]
MHPTAELRSVKSDRLKGKRIVLGVTGSIAAVECVKLSRELIRHGADVIAVMTPEATRILGASAMEFATGNPVITELTGAVEHVSLCGDVPDRADLLLLSPCTANTLGKVVLAIDDTPVTTFATTAIGTGIPVMIVPAMHGTMYQHPVVQENLEKARGMGLEIVQPLLEESKAKMAPLDEIVGRVVQRLSDRALYGKKVLIVTGATQEPIDDMRVVTNVATGRSGIYLALEAHSHGAEVLLLVGKGVTGVPGHIRSEIFGTTADLVKNIEGLREVWGVPDMAIFSAAISDYSPVRKEGKLPSGEKGMVVKMERTPKVVEAFRREYPDAFLVGYKAEALSDREELLRRAYRRLTEVGMDLIVANDLKDVGEERNIVLLITPGKDAFEVDGRKEEIARFIMDKSLEMLRE